MKKSLRTEGPKSKKAAVEEKNSKLFQLSAQVGRGMDSAVAEYRHVAWINVYSLLSGGRMPKIVGIFECEAYRDSVSKTGPARANAFPEVLCFIFPENPKTLYTASFSNALRLWGAYED